MLNERQKNLIHLLEQAQCYLTSKELSKMLGVTDRTIRSDIEKINSQNGYKLIESHKRYGYKITAQIVQFQHDNENSLLIPQSSNERCMWLLKELLSTHEGVNIHRLCERLFISEYSIEGDIKKIKDELIAYPTLTIHRTNSFIFLEGKEENKRQLYKDLLMKETKGNFINLTAITDIWKNFDLIKIKNSLEKLLEIHQYDIDEGSLPMIMLHAGVAIDRICQQKYVAETKVSEDLMSSKEYEIATSFFQEIFEGQSIEMSKIKNEIELFSLLLSGKKHRHYRKNTLEDNEEVKVIIDAIVEKIKKRVDIDFSQDDELKIGLELHIQGLIERQRQRIVLSNDYLKEIKRKYPLVFEMAIYAGEAIFNHTSTKVNENELAFLSLHLGAAFERISQNKLYQVVAIMPFNNIFSEICIDKIKKRFVNQIEFKAILPYFEEGKISEYNPDFIISTTFIEHALSIPTVTISLFVDTEDERKLFDLLDMLEKQRQTEKFQMLIHELIREDLFYIENGKNYNNSKEIIQTLCDRLTVLGLADNLYKEDVIKRDEISSTSFVQGFAVPHSITVSTKESCLSVMILDKSVKWGEFDVNLVILLGIHESEQFLLKNFFLWLSNISKDPKKFATLLKVKNREEFIQYILQ